MTIETTDIAEGMDFKSIVNGASISIDEAEGIVECFAAAIGNKDSVGDIILPNAFEKSLKRRTPRVVWGHDWNHPIGKVLEAYEVGPNDPRLPPKMKAAGVGGLYAKVKFNLKSEKGREAFANIIFFGEDQEWSIGYKTLDGEYSGKLQANLLKEVELYEMSPVLHGANQLTSTISIKSDESDDEAIKKGLAKLKTFCDENPDFADEVHASMNEKRDFSADKRREMANRGSAMPDGSFPIANAEDLKNAIRLAGKSKNPAAARAHIKKRASALGLTHLLPDEWKSVNADDEVQVELGEVELKEAWHAELDEKAGIPGAEPNSGLADITHGRGPRRGNLEDLLRYWRPIMKKPGGFRRCLVILADHPELGPLPNLCAWLHHETTGKWPNEGHHHGKSAEWNFGANPAQGDIATLAKALSHQFGGTVMIHSATKDQVVYDETTENGVATYKSAYAVIDDSYFFAQREKTSRPRSYMDDHAVGEECDCGGKCCTEKKEKSQGLEDVLEKVGRAISTRNLGKLRQAVALLNEVIAVGGDDDLMVKENEIVIKSASKELESALNTVNSYHGSESRAFTDGSIHVEVKSDKHRIALEKVVSAFSALEEGVGL